MAIESMILSNLVLNEDYGRKIFPFLKEEYFTSGAERVTFDLVREYMNKYSRFPSVEAMAIDLSQKPGITEATFDACKELIAGFSVDPTTEYQWLVDQTEKYCQQKSIERAIMDSLTILEDKTGKFDRGMIPKLMSDALAVNFDESIGHDYFMNFEHRYEYYHRIEFKVPFDIALLNKVTKGGVSQKTLNIILAGTNVGKSMIMCHFAANNLMDHKNVLYITLEMAEEEISKRIDANLLDVTMDELMELPMDSYASKIGRVKDKTRGRLIVKEYPTGCASAANFRHLLEELKIKKKFKPDIIYIDYLNICMSSRIKMGANINSYQYIKSIAEELRGLAVEYAVPVFSATQTTRSGFASSDVDLTDTSESWGLPQTADFMFAVTRSEQLDELGQIMIKQLKSRYGRTDENRRFTVGVELAKMKLYDVEQSAQEGILDGPQEDRPLMDRTGFGQKDFQRSAGQQKKKSFGFSESNFEKFK